MKKLKLILVLAEAVDAVNEDEVLVRRATKAQREYLGCNSIVYHDIHGYSRDYPTFVGGFIKRKTFYIIDEIELTIDEEMVGFDKKYLCKDSKGNKYEVLHSIAGFQNKIDGYKIKS